MMRAWLIVLAAGCAAPPRPASPGSAPSSGRAVERADLRIRAAPTRDDAPIDATFDQEARGGRPTWTPPPAVAGGIRVTLESLAPEARRCFSPVLAPGVAVTLTVRADGRAAGVIVETEDTRARDCLESTIRRAVFPNSRRAWRVDYLFRF